MAAQATIVCVISTDAPGRVTEAVGLAANVGGVARRPDDSTDFGAVRSLWAEVRRRPPVYALAAFDPFAGLVKAWSDRLTGQADDLELTIGLLPELDAPDYYLVDDGIGDPMRAWYFELLFTEAPQRIAAFDGSTDGVIRTLRDLPFGRALPSASRLAELARGFVPGTKGVAPAPLE